MHCIITGFDPFGDSGTNPSQQVVGRLPDAIELADGAMLEVTRAILPTCCDGAWKALQKAVAEVPPGRRFSLVMSGLADTREKISLEWFALNMRAYRIADNSGHQFQHDPISPRGIDALQAKANLPNLLARLEEQGLNASISYHAGTFVCNETYYRALKKWMNNDRCTGIVFVHLPALENYKAGNGKMPKVTSDKAIVDQYATALSEAAKLISSPTRRKGARLAGSRR